MGIKTNTRKAFLINYCILTTLYAILIILIISTFEIQKALSVSNPVTPTPTMGSGPCKAVVTYSWNVSNIPDANRVFWELKKDSDFTNLEGRESNRIGSGASNNLQGSITIDLRNYGQVLNGTKYYFRVVAKDGTNDVARRSDSVKFDLNSSPDGKYSAITFPQDPYQVKLDWSDLEGSEIGNCSDRIFYEVKRNSPFTNLTGAEPGRIDSGSAAGNLFTTINLSQQQPGDYYVRIAGKSGGTSINDDVGERGSGVKVVIGQQESTPPQQFQPVNINTEVLKMTGLRELQTMPTARLNLRVRDSSSSTNFIPNAKVTVKNNSSSANTPQYNSSQLTNTNGTAVFRNLQNRGTYDLRVESTGCQNSLSEYTLPSSGDANHEIQLDCATQSSDISLPPGVAPPVEDVGSRAIGLDLKSFKFGNGNKVQDARYDVPIEYESSGMIPAFYRARRCPITNGQWKPVSQSSPPTINLLTEGNIKYCFQLKSNTGKESNILERRYLVKLVERTTSSDQFPIRYAKQKGFNFGARDQIPNSGCGFDDSFEILYWNFQQDSKCKYSLFQGRKLNYPWKVKDVRIIKKPRATGGSVIKKISPSMSDENIKWVRKPSGDSLYFTFTLEEKSRVSEDQVLSPAFYGFEYVLLGPINVPIMNAFD